MRYVLSTRYLVGWGLGLIEGILCVLVVGFSVDYTVHLTDSYMESKCHTRYEKVHRRRSRSHHYRYLSVTFTLPVHYLYIIFTLPVHYLYITFTLQVQDALSITGVSVVSGAISTLGASIPMLFATITFFTKFGIFMLLTIVLSLTCVPKSEPKRDRAAAAAVVLLSSAPEEERASRRCRESRRVVVVAAHARQPALREMKRRARACTRAARARHIVHKHRTNPPRVRIVNGRRVMALPRDTTVLRHAAR